METLEFVKLLKKQYQIKSDYGICKLLSISNNTLSSWRLRGSVMSDEIAERVADKLELPYVYVLVCLCAERSRYPNAKKTLRTLARSLVTKKSKIVKLRQLS